MPRSIALWMTLRVASRSMRPAKLLQPRPTSETLRPDLPSVRVSTGRVPLMVFQCEIVALAILQGLGARTLWASAGIVVSLSGATEAFMTITIVPTGAALGAEI